MADLRGRIPLFIDPTNHQAFVRRELSSWPDTYFHWAVYCPACPDMAIACVGNYQGAYDIAIGHRIDEEAWSPTGELLMGPVAKWGPRP